MGIAWRHGNSNIMCRCEPSDVQLVDVTFRSALCQLMFHLDECLHIIDVLALLFSLFIYERGHTHD